MNDYLVTFYTEQNRRHEHQQIGDWLLDLAKELHLSGATLSVAAEGFGQDGKRHSAHFFELADQPIQVTMALTQIQHDMLFQRLESEDLALFYIKTPAEIGTVGRHRPSQETESSSS
ncbi:MULTISPECIES: DUF190 domain-containing protein [Pseudomonadaceae]|jgi:PII-like signaling protein|uniref:Uncharacterized protein DUF190 n=3 Tax=Pseudomonadaceae TaxID=135621 RepID=A0A3D9EIE2_ECTOL|nr:MULTISPECIES: DUF190 domain-containing protein [Pseudomonas]KTS78195.1 hypothetical protein NS274_07635 [Pseudomonas psychrotolerans]KTT25427.1 hypothetical protein SB14R_06710 [Pseudomonas psychrotolerans]KTT30112.1 hypothetical protein NS201_14125 [Pseudomonas psychrotolerans]KTT36590.1 hypothetical protein SB9_05745 [Pseudomonas psychrotolerans]KTT38866.1 hypothetical protein SB5_14735 [Pseudomonas psychrotolerans]